MFLSTFLNIIFIPVLYVVIETVRERVTGAPTVQDGGEASAEA
jgi:hypothetical protein